MIFIGYLRSPGFGSPIELMAQIRRDVESTRGYFERRPVHSLDLVTP